MNKLAALIVFVVVSGAVALLCANAHIDIFPCRIVERDRMTGSTETRYGSCSLMAHLDPMNTYDNDRTLTGDGIVFLCAFCGGIGLVAGLAVGFAARKRTPV